MTMLVWLCTLALTSGSFATSILSINSIVTKETDAVTLHSLPASWSRLIKYRGGNLSGVYHVSSSDEFDRLVQDNPGKLFVVDFSATWCMPCKMIAPMFEEMANPSGEFGNVVFVKIDVDEVPDLAEKFQVQAMPTFLFMKDNKEVDRFSGASVEKLRQTLVTHSSPMV